jgi:hypothetical protein
MWADLGRLGHDERHQEQQRLENAFGRSFSSDSKIRCEFMYWMIEQNLATPDPDPSKEGFYILPEEIQLHPSAMTDIEQNLIQLARENSYNQKTEPPIEIKRQFYETLENYKNPCGNVF